MKLTNNSSRQPVLLFTALLVLSISSIGTAYYIRTTQYIGYQSKAASLDRNNIPQMTQALRDTSLLYKQAKAANKPSALADLQVTSLMRRNALLSTIETNPRLVLDNAISPSERQSLPPEVQLQVEEEVTLEGEFEYLHADDFEKKTSKEWFYVKTPDDKRTQVFFADGTPDALTGDKVRVQGVKLSDKMAVSSANSAAFQKLTTNVLGVAAPGPKKVAVILFNFSNDRTQPWTADQIRQTVFTNSPSTNSFFKELSFNKTSLVGIRRTDGDVFGWKTINSVFDGTRCTFSDVESWSREAAQLVRADGINLDLYDYVIYNFRPSQPICPVFAYVGGRESYIPNSGWSGIAHEMGHNFGLLHANALLCKDSTGRQTRLSNSCTSREYGDVFDIMGVGNYHFNGYEKDRLGWLAANNIQTIATTGPHSVTIYPIEKATSGVQLVRIIKDLYNDGRIRSYYYIEFRRRIGYDSFPSNYSIDGVTIRVASEFTTAWRPELLDMTAGDNLYLFRDATLPLNQTFTDPVKKIKITTTSISQSSATVVITIPVVSCSICGLYDKPVTACSGVSCPLGQTCQAPQKNCTVGGISTTCYSRGVCATSGGGVTF